jgi:von Willebrand factor type A domain
MTSAAFTATTSPRPARLAAAVGISGLAHVVFLLLVIFDVAGIGGGFGLGVGPGFGLGAGGGAGVGQAHRRQIFSIEDLPELRRPDDTTERLAELLEPERQAAVTIPKTPAPTVNHSAVIHFARPVRPLGASVDLSRRFAATGAGTGGIGLGGGGGGAGWSLGFSKYVGSLRKVGLDVAIVVDATGSMQNVIDELKQRLGTLVSTMQRLVPTARIGVVAFRDRDDKTATAPRRSEDFLVRWTDLTYSSKKVTGFLNALVAEGGGDWEEAVKAGLETAMKQLKWRPDAKKVIILVGSSPPHDDTVPAIRALAEQWRAKGGVISTIDVSERLHEEHERKLYKWLYGEDLKKVSPLPAFYAQVRESYDDIARRGGGESVALGQEKVLAQHLLALAFGPQWKKDITRIGRGL